MGSIGTVNDDVDRNKLYDIVFSYASLKPSKKTKHPAVAFSAFVTDFSDNFTQRWSSQTVYGKPDAIEVYQNTSRNITLSWAVPSVGPREGYLNMVKLETLLKMLYPVYGKPSGVSTISRPPLLRLKFANFIFNPANGKGLLGHVQGFSFKPNIEMGYYNAKSSKQMKGVNKSKDFSDKVVLIPKEYSMSCAFTVLHEKDLGYSKSGKFAAGNNFPYGYTDDDGELVQVANKGKVNLNVAGHTKDSVAESQLAKITGVS